MDPDGGNQRLRASLFSTGMRVALPDQSNRQPGAADRTLTTVSEVAQEAVWSPDSSRIAFYRTGAIWIVGVDRSEQHSIDNAREPVWSTDGTRISYTSDTFRGVLVSDADGRDQRRLTEETVSKIAWSPDGDRIAYSFRDSVWSPWRIYTVPTDGGNRKLIRDAENFSPLATDLVTRRRTHRLLQ